MSEPANGQPAEHSAQRESLTQPHEGEVERFWADAKVHARLDGVPSYFGPTPLASVVPPTWAFGDDPELADRLLDLVLDGEKTAMASAREDYGDDPLPERGSLSIVLDSQGHPRALIATSDVEVVPFDEVSEAHARAEGEGDRTLAGWRADHERFFTDHDPLGRGFRVDMPVVLESFVLLHPSRESRATFRAMFLG